MNSGLFFFLCDAPTLFTMHNIPKRVSCITCCFHQSQDNYADNVSSLVQRKTLLFQPVLSNRVFSSYLPQAEYCIRCQQPLCVAPGARFNSQSDPAASSGQAV